jgi:predicted nuclease with RNAse H fold
MFAGSAEASSAAWYQLWYRKGRDTCTNMRHTVMSRWLGVDVGGKRKGLDIALVDKRQVLALRSRLNRAALVELVEAEQPTVVAIDSPRCCAPAGQSTRDGERQLARSICGIRWTPDERRVHASAYYAWIVEGLALFDALAAHNVEVIEVFPTASWTRWFGERGNQTRSVWSRQGLVALGLGGVPPRTNQDQRDAIAAAVTGRQHTLGMTQELGEIVVPAGPWRPPTGSL